MLCVLETCTCIRNIYAKVSMKWGVCFLLGPQWPSGLASLASNHRLPPLCGFKPPTSGNPKDLSKYDPGC